MSYQNILQFHISVRVALLVDIFQAPARADHVAQRPLNGRSPVHTVFGHQARDDSIAVRPVPYNVAHQRFKLTLDTKGPIYK